MDLMNSPNESLEYEFEAKLDTGGFGPSIRVKEKGEFRMDGKNVPNESTKNAVDPVT